MGDTSGLTHVYVSRGALRNRKEWHSVGEMCFIVGGRGNDKLEMPQTRAP